jgi:hypothetical protein
MESLMIRGFFLHPYFNERKLARKLVVFCGRCEGEFLVVLKKRRSFPTIVCPICKAENRFDIVWK